MRNLAMRKKNNFFIKIILASALAAVSTCAVAITVSFDLQIANPSTAIFRLTNTSSSAEITGFSATIGDTTKNFDLVNNIAAYTDTGSTLAWTLNSPDLLQDNVRSDVVDWTLTGFDPGDRFDFNVDIDDDMLGNTNEVFNQVFFNNGMSPNSVITVWFTDGGATGSISMTLPDDSTPNKARYDYSGTGQIPEPPTLLLLAIGMAGIGFKRWAKS
jgi:hypothetical protein